MSVEKTLDILDLFDFKTRELTVQEMANKLEQPQSSVYRHLKVLKDRSLITETNKGTYRLGYRFLEMAKIVKSDINLSSVAFPIMQELCKQLNETVILTIVSNLNVICLEVVTPDQPIKVSSTQGKILPLHAGASSRILLAHLDDNIIFELEKKDMLEKYSDYTFTDVEKLFALKKEVLEKGYAVSDSEVDIGVYAYGVAIKDIDKKLVAGLSIAGPKERLIAVDESYIVETLFESRDKIQEFL
ncbi:IclR family transcriptional regulator [Solibacillus sp. FSL K6-1523]|uniref:IclR family transcriptional regulator n=1 Tax=Solibacillus sp. FSL K6-1523 TaxID=2921471 RepID=UPI0030F96F5B